MKRLAAILLGGLLAMPVLAARGTGDLGVLIERADGSLQIVDNSANRSLARVDGLGSKIAFEILGGDALRSRSCR